MNNKIAVYNKISALDHIKIEPFDITKRFTKPHRHTKYLELVYFKKGQGSHFMDDERFAIIPPIIFLIGKEEVHHWEITTVPKGYVMIIKEGFLNTTLDQNINSLLQRLKLEKAIKISKDRSIDYLFKVLCSEKNQHSSMCNEVIEGALKSLLAKIIGYLDDRHQYPYDLASQFTAQLENQLKNDVSYYADLLNTTSQNLNSVCKKRFSKTASQVIAIHLIQETKRLLLYTNLSVAEISIALDFKDVSHFVKYFKRQVGKTPLQFKKERIQ